MIANHISLWLLTFALSFQCIIESISCAWHRKSQYRPSPAPSCNFFFSCRWNKNSLEHWVLIRVKWTSKKLEFHPDFWGEEMDYTQAPNALASTRWLPHCCLFDFVFFSSRWSWYCYKSLFSATVEPNPIEKQALVPVAAVDSAGPEDLEPYHSIQESLYFT